MKSPIAENLRGPLQVALLVFLVALAPLLWLFAHLRHDATLRDNERLAELVTATRKALMNESVKHDGLMRAWRNRIATGGIPTNDAEWESIFEGPKSLGLGRFRAVGFARWEDGDRLIVRFSRSQKAEEEIPVGTDLGALPEIRAAVEKSSQRGEVTRVGEIVFSAIGKRAVALTSLTTDKHERAVILTTLGTQDFLTPTQTIWAKTGTMGGIGNQYIQNDSLPGVGEGIVKIDLASSSGKISPGFQWSSAFGDLRLRFRPGPKFARDSLADEAWIVLGGGTFVALLLATLAWMQARQRSVLRDQVRHRTTELREANVSLSQYKAVVETTSDLVGLCDMDGTPIFMNRAGRSLLGIGPDESLDAYPFDRIHTPENLKLFASEGIPHAMEHGSWSAEINMRHGDGHEIPVAFEGVVIKSTEGDSFNLGCIARDITASRQLDLQLRASLENERELVRLKSQFVNTVSHEFRTPLGVILSSTDILTHYLDRLTEVSRRDHLNDIFQSCKHMSRMLEQVLVLGGIEAGNASFVRLPLDLAALLSRIADESSSASLGGPIRLEIATDLAGASGDEGLMRHIFLNLLSNARKYSAPDAAIEFAAGRNGGDAVFTVRDHGIGIPAKDLPHLFESFSRGSNVEDAPGTGLGLSIVERCVHLHAGTVAIESEEGRGTLVTLRLPLFIPQS